METLPAEQRRGAFLSAHQARSPFLSLVVKADGVKADGSQGFGKLPHLPAVFFCNPADFLFQANTAWSLDRHAELEK